MPPYTEEEWEAECRRAYREGEEYARRVAREREAQAAQQSRVTSFRHGESHSNNPRQSFSPPSHTSEMSGHDSNASQSSSVFFVSSSPAQGHSHQHPSPNDRVGFSPAPARQSHTMSGGRSPGPSPPVLRVTPLNPQTPVRDARTPHSSSNLSQGRTPMPDMSRITLMSGGREHHFTGQVFDFSQVAHVPERRQLFRNPRPVPSEWLHDQRSQFRVERTARDSPEVPDSTTSSYRGGRSPSVDLDNVHPGDFGARSQHRSGPTNQPQQISDTPTRLPPVHRPSVRFESPIESPRTTQSGAAAESQTRSQSPSKSKSGSKSPGHKRQASRTISSSPKRTYTKPVGGARRQLACMGCVRSILAGLSDGICRDVTNASTERCARCFTGHKCEPAPRSIALLSGKLTDEYLNQRRQPRMKKMRTAIRELLVLEEVMEDGDSGSDSESSSGTFHPPPDPNPGVKKGPRGPPPPGGAGSGGLSHSRSQERFRIISTLRDDLANS